MGWDIAVVSDSKVAVAWINNEDIGNLAHINSIYDIRSCMSTFGSLEVVYDSRAFNSLADSLAKMGSSMVENDTIRLREALQRDSPRKWKDHVRVILNDEKVPLSKICLIEYYKPGYNEVSTSCREGVPLQPPNQGGLHECMIYHAAYADKNWKCSDKPNDKITCNDNEERKGRKSYRGCPRVARVSGASNAALRTASAAYVFTSFRTPSLKQLINRAITFSILLVYFQYISTETK
ncbi:hypothetical protein Dsin_022614 [Dipteronia sinensis]|uniref:RNase H type-1 domain-containing protein n=1 Tax=Dipteronia sinensis TaxID=43782 RepID=A0AAE0A2U4_9ROSI|nr:hypothetical protein Dsin_022614 [Dipteronia sinensis]